MRRIGLFSGIVAGVLVLASPALAGWGEDWGTMVWGAAPVGVPTLGLLGFGLLSLALAAGAVFSLRRRSWTMSVLLVLLAIPLVVVAGTVSVPNTFVNGEIADADEVNENFDAIETAVNDNDSLITTLETDTATALSNADTALTDAAAAQAEADAAVLDAATALSTATAAATDADAAQVTADTALADAAAAQSTADKASGAAATAQGTATTANANAAAASSAAAAAQGTADAATTVNTTQAADITELQAQVTALQAYLISTTCGNNVVEPIEGCDDGDAANTGNGCSASCQVISVCGNGAVESLYENCDDGDTADGDGCSALCEPEQGWECTGEPSACSFTARHEDCGDGTIADLATGLMWDKKDFGYEYSSANATLFWELQSGLFITTLNSSDPGFAGLPLGGHTDWRAPTISELQSTMVGPGVLTTTTDDPLAGANPTAQATTCDVALCIDPSFAALAGTSTCNPVPIPLLCSGYWSASSVASNPNLAWQALPNGEIGTRHKEGPGHVRGVRTGSCTD